MPSAFTLETDRFILRPPLKKDIPTILKHMQQPSISANTLHIPYPGAVGLHLNPEHNRAEAGYWIAVPYWNKGVATEALIRIMEFGFKEVKLNKILATHLVDNPSSGRVMIKAGMTKEGKLNEHYQKGTKYITVIQYAMTLSTYHKLQKRKSNHE